MIEVKGNNKEWVAYWEEVVKVVGFWSDVPAIIEVGNSVPEAPATSDNLLVIAYQLNNRAPALKFFKGLEVQAPDVKNSHNSSSSESVSDGDRSSFTRKDEVSVDTDSDTELSSE